ncbi:class I SAM-dependent methyltransferase [Thiorhodovibrio frisius]|uniref:Methyltransferase family protein n=1 Tax=Thiorhodovibrio frisius TaxID=631362 RepID=H8Z0W0_9GAMM|nr:class I SAM-dependent methyltransferase [Thiorhodovibrio frisius]EIC21342.1 methyltransferase family protein [Thiorhodovibrio frisius]WPL23926.1 Mg-protoporphyrin IX methyl transferase [Thiorhodovibrio frisius]
MKISQGQTEHGIFVGNAYDKYQSTNPLVQRIMQGFELALAALVARSSPASIHEIGCGEGYWVLRWLRAGYRARGCDFSHTVINIARENARLQLHQAPAELFSVTSVYDLDPALDSADLIVCCEVLEHLQEPTRALAVLASLRAKYLILSVPREPLWRALNILRCAYLPQAGNTPGHIQHWSSHSFQALVAQYFDIIAVRRPLPWCMLLCRPRT